MRSLSAGLLAEQKSASGAPYIRTVVSNKIRGLRHHVFTQTMTDTIGDLRHGAAADTTYLHQLAAHGNGNCYYQRSGTGYFQKNTLGSVTQVAIAAVNNARVILVYNSGLGIYFRESTDQGANFGAETFIVNSAGTINGLAVAYKNTSGDLAVIWADGATLKRIRRTSGTFGSATSWAQTAATINGVAVLWNGDFNIVLTGTETTTLRPTLWSLALGDGFSYTVDTWTAFFIQAQAEADESITFQAPSIGLLDTTRITFVEKFSGSPAYTRTYWTSIALSASFSPGNWEWMDPAPLNNALNYGYAVCKGKTPQVAIYSHPNQVLEAPTAAVTLDMCADLIEAVIEERDGITQRGEFVFDNSNNQYAGPPSPIALHRTLDIGLGYDAAYSSPPAQTIVGWEWRRDGGKSQFVLHTRGAEYWLALSKARTTIVQSRTLTTIARAAGARAGLDFISSGASSRAGALTLEWVVQPFQTQLHILQTLAAIMPDIFLTTPPSTLTLTEPLAGDAVDYTYGTDHAIYHSRFADEPTASVAEVAAVGVLGSAYDYAEMNNDKPIQQRTRSPHETATADADANATAQLRKSVLEQGRGELVTPPNCGLEIADVVGLTDAAISGSQVIARVTAITTVLKRNPSSGRPTYEQRVELGGV